MADRTSIEWTDATWNPIRARFEPKAGDEPGAPRLGWHCEHVSEGCRRCYAESINRRLGTLLPFKPGHRRDVDIFLDEKMLAQPLRWKRPRMIFVGSMTDLFADFVPDAMIDALFAVMALTPHHTYQVLTKRPDRMKRYMEGRAGKLARFMIDEYLLKGCTDQPTKGRAINVAWPVASVGDIDQPEDVTMRHWPLPNVWLGTSAEDQDAAASRIPTLLQSPAAKHFLSAEPLLGPLDLNDIPWDVAGYRLRGVLPRPEEADDFVYACHAQSLDWVIVGGESGRGARPMHLDWVRSLRDQCSAAGVPFLFKQWGEWLPCRHLRERRSLDWVPEALDGSGRSFRFGPYQGQSHVFMQNPTCRSFDDVIVWRLGKKVAGRLLDGVQHDGMPA